MKEVKYTYPLDEHGAVVYEAEFTKHHGVIETFKIQLLVQHEGEWWPIIRYDNHHGFPHCDRLHINPNRLQVKEPLDMSNNEALTYAIDDVTMRWKVYVERFLRGDYP